MPADEDFIGVQQPEPKIGIMRNLINDVRDVTSQSGGQEKKNSDNFFALLDLGRSTSTLK